MKLNLNPGLLRGLLRLHKKKQRNGLWCARACPFHRIKTAEEHWATHTNGWSFLVVDNIDKLAKEGAL